LAVSNRATAAVWQMAEWRGRQTGRGRSRGAGGRAEAVRRQPGRGRPAV